MRKRKAGEGGLRRDKGGFLIIDLSSVGARLLADEGLVGTRGMVIEVSAGREILSHTEWLYHSSIRYRQTMEGTSSLLRGDMNAYTGLCSPVIP